MTVWRPRDEEWIGGTLSFWRMHPAHQLPSRPQGVRRFLLGIEVGVRGGVHPRRDTKGVLKGPSHGVDAQGSHRLHRSGWRSYAFTLKKSRGHDNDPGAQYEGFDNLRHGEADLEASQDDGKS